MFVFSPLPKLHTICIGLFGLLLNFQVLAQCDNYIGTLPDEDDFYLCYGASLVLQVDSVVLMDNQKLFYVFHTHEDLLLEGAIIEINQTGLLQNYLFPPGEIFATAFIGSAPVNFDDPCLALSNTISVVNLEPIHIETEINCGSIKGFSFSITGGLPEFDVESYYDVSGSHFNGKLKANELVTIETEYSAFVPEYKMLVNDEVGCNQSYQSPQRNDCYHLPIQLISYNVQNIIVGNLLEWITLSRVDIDFFKIEVSKDEINWMLLDTIKVNETYFEITEYEFLDVKKCDGICYYRLFAVGIDGIVSFMGIVQISPPNYFRAYPTFTSNLLNIGYSINEPVRLSIYDTMGRTVFSSKEESNQTYNQTEIDISHLPNNMYFLVITSDDFTATEKFVVQR